MKTAESKTVSAAKNAKASRPFFPKKGAGIFGKNESERHPFFNSSSGYSVHGNGILQTKLTVGQPNDRYEKEADAMADKVVQRLANPEIQRKCTACEKEETIQPKAESSASLLAAPHIEGHLNASRGNGSPLSADIRTQMETSFNSDFSGVRLHTDHTAAQMNKDLHAQAFTLGNDIYFNSGRYSPNTLAGKHLLAHELTHTIQQGKSISRKIQRFTAACRGLLNNPVGSISRALTGIVVHQAILEDFLVSTSGGLSGFGIPGASAAPLRTAGLCGEDIPTIVPQIIGGRSGMGFPDLARNTGAVMQVAEIKPASWNCAIDGIAQLAGYITQGNATDPAQTAWRASQGLVSIIPMPPSVYPGKTLIIGNYTVQTEWCSPGLLVYQVIGSSQPLPVPVPVPETRPSPVEIRQRTGWERIRDFAEEAIRTGATSGVAIRSFLQANPDLISLIIGIGVAGLVATFAEDIATFGAGILDDLVTVPFFAAMIRIAMQMRPA